MANEATAPMRFWAKHKVQAVLRPLAGEEIEHLNRELGMTAAALSEWRDTFRERGQIDAKLLAPILLHSLWRKANPHENL